MVFIKLDFIIPEGNLFQGQVTAKICWHKGFKSYPEHLVHIGKQVFGLTEGQRNWIEAIEGRRQYLLQIMPGLLVQNQIVQLVKASGSERQHDDQDKEYRNQQTAYGSTAIFFKKRQTVLDE